MKGGFFFNLDNIVPSLVKCLQRTPNKLKIGQANQANQLVRASQTEIRAHNLILSEKQRCDYNLCLEYHTLEVMRFMKAVNLVSFLLALAKHKP